MVWIRRIGRIIPNRTKTPIRQTRQSAQQIAVDLPQQITTIGEVVGLAKSGRFPETKQNQRNKLIPSQFISDSPPGKTSQPLQSRTSRHDQLRTSPHGGAVVVVPFPPMSPSWIAWGLPLVSSCFWLRATHTKCFLREVSVNSLAETGDEASWMAFGTGRTMKCRSSGSSLSPNGFCP